MVKEAARLLDELLAEYVNQLNRGKRPDLNIYLNQCPVESREELKGLMEYSRFIGDSFNSPGAYERSLQNTLKMVASLSYQHPTGPEEKSVVNYRASEELSPEEEEKAQAAIDEIWKKFEEDDK